MSLFLTGKQEDKEREVENAMYHDWRLLPKHEETDFTRFEPVPEPPIRYVIYPPLLRAMILAQKGLSTTEEPMLPLRRDILLSKEYFRNQDQERQRQRQAGEGTPVWVMGSASKWLQREEGHGREPKHSWNEHNIEATHY